MIGDAQSLVGEKLQNPQNNICELAMKRNSNMKTLIVFSGVGVMLGLVGCAGEPTTTKTTTTHQTNTLAPTLTPTQQTTTQQAMGGAGYGDRH